MACILFLDAYMFHEGYKLCVFDIYSNIHLIDISNIICPQICNYSCEQKYGKKKNKCDQNYN